MEKFAEQRNVKLEKIPPLHPSSNPVETFMKPIGKTMKIAHHKGQDEKAALQKLLENYRDTPHPSTGVPPAAMLFRDSMTSAYPRKSVTEDKIETARRYDEQQKSHHESDVNSLKYKQHANISLGDQVLVRNYNKTRKFQPLFCPEQYVVTDIADYGRKLQIERLSDGQTLVRHPDDLKQFVIPNQPTPAKNVTTPDPWKILSYPEESDSNYSVWNDNAEPHMMNNLPAENAGVVNQEQPAVNQQEPRRSGRERHHFDRFGVVAYDEHQPLRGEDLVIQPWWPGYPRV